MHLGDAIITLGAGGTILTLPDVNFNYRTTGGFNQVFTDVLQNNEIDDEVGWNFDGSVEIPLYPLSGGYKSIVLSGFTASFEDTDALECHSTNTSLCRWTNIIDHPTQSNSIFVSAGFDLHTTTRREVDYWGGALEGRWYQYPGGVDYTMPGYGQYFALGVDLRTIDQALDMDGFEAQNPNKRFEYDESLDTSYTGVFGAWGTDLGLFEVPGLYSSLRLQGGVYRAQTDYHGNYRSFDAVNDAGELLLSRGETVLIGGIGLEVSQKLGPRTKLSLTGDLEYISWVPDMAYNNQDATAGGTTPGPNVGTSIGGDDALSMSVGVKLTIILGPVLTHE